MIAAQVLRALRVVGLEMPLASVHRGEWVGPAEKGSLNFGSRPLADAGDRRLQGKPKFINVIMETQVMERTLSHPGLQTLEPRVTGIGCVRGFQYPGKATRVSGLIAVDSHD
jgi:hypothetical protein